MVLGAAVNEGSEMLITTLDQMMTGLHVQASIEPDYNNLQVIAVKIVVLIRSFAYNAHQGLVPGKIFRLLLKFLSDPATLKDM